MKLPHTHHGWQISAPKVLWPFEAEHLLWCPVQKYIYLRFPSETVTRSGYQVS